MLSTMYIRACLVTAVILVVGGPAAGQSIRNVDDDASTNGDGLTWDTAYKYLQDALLEAANDPGITEIRVAGGTYKPDQDEGGGVTPGDRLATFQLLDNVSLKGGYAGLANPISPDERDLVAYQSTLSGDLAGNDDPADFPDGLTFEENTCRVVTGSGTGPTARLDGFTVTAGRAEHTLLPHWSGGGLYNQGGSPTVVDCIFLGNAAMASGGGVLNDNSAPTLINCRLLGNDAHYGGGMHNFQADPVLINCIFSGNRATGDG